MYALEKWHFSRFVHFIPLGEYTAVYNALNMAVLFLENKVARGLQQRSWSLEGQKAQSLIEEMIKEKMLVEPNHDDLADYRKIQDELSKLPVKILYLLLTDQCNFACRYCFIEGGFPPGHQRVQMTPEVAQTSIDLYARALVRNLTNEKVRKRVIFYGGEPLLNFPTMAFAIDYIEELKQKGKLPNDVKLSLNTNASVVTPEIAKTLAEHHVSVSVSIDGRKRIHNQERIFRSGEGTFDATIRGFMLLKKHGIDPGISCTIAELGVDHLEETITFFIEELDIHSIGFNILREGQTVRLADPEGYTRKASQALIDAFKIAREKGVYEDRIMRKVRAFVRRRPYLNDCAGCGGEIAAAPDGEVGVCHGAVGAKDFYVPNTPEFDVHTHPYWTEWRSRSPFNMSECIECVALGICGGGCPYQGYLREGSIWAVEKLFCIHAKTTLEFLIRDLFEKMVAKQNS